LLHVLTFITFSKKKKGWEQKSASGGRP
jgi:hypothetical protein